MSSKTKKLLFTGNITLPQDSINKLGKGAFDFFIYGCRIGFKFNNINLIGMCEDENESFWYNHHFGYAIDDGIHMENLNLNVIRAFNLNFEDVLDIAKYKWCLEKGCTIKFSQSKNISMSNFERKISNIEQFINEEKNYKNMIKAFKDMDYRTCYLNTEHWKNFKEEALRHFNYKCHKCEIDNIDNNVTMDVHHLTYCNIGRETFNDVVVLCRECHYAFHKNYSKNITIEQFEKFMLDK